MNWIKPGALLSAATLVSLLLLEFGVRKILPNPLLFNSFQEPVDYGEFATRRLRPNTAFKHTSKDGVFYFKTNADGFRMDYNIAEQKAPGSLRVLMLGDSHTQGFEVQGDETFSTLLDKKQCGNNRLEVINTGISGSGTSEHLVALQHLYKKFKPDVVIEAFFSNDRFNNKNAFHTLENGQLKVVRYIHPATTGLKLLRYHNNFFVTRWLSQNVSPKR